MKLDDMNADERLALGSLVRLMVGADGRFSPGEDASLQQAAEHLGEDLFWQAVEEAGHLDSDDEPVKARAQAVERQEVRETIYRTLFEIAAAGSIVDAEGRILDWLSEAWSLESTETASEEG